VQADMQIADDVVGALSGVGRRVGAVGR